MGNASFWTYSVILLCLGGIAFGQRYPYENASNGYQSKLNLRNFLGSKLVQRLSENQNVSPYEPYERRMACEPPPLPPLPPRPQSTFPRGVIYQNEFQRIQPPMDMGSSMGAPTPMGSLPHHMMGPPPQSMGLPPPHAMVSPSSMGSLSPMGSQPPHTMGHPSQSMGHSSQPMVHSSQSMGHPSQSMGHPSQSIGPPPSHAMGLPPPHSMGPPPHAMGHPPHAMGHPPHAMGHPPSRAVGPPHGQQMGPDSDYEETHTCPCSACSECEAANQDYAYSDEPCPYCGCSEGRSSASTEESCPCCACSEGRCPCEEECPCAQREGGSGRNRPSCPCEDRYSQCPACDSYSDKDYPDRESNYDDYSSGDCPCCECAKNAYPDEPQTAPAFVKEHPSYQHLPPENDNYADEPMEGQHQGDNCGPPSYRSGSPQPSYAPPPPPPPSPPPPRYQQYEAHEAPQYMKPIRMRNMARNFMPPPDMRGGPPMHHMPEPIESQTQDRAVHHAEITQRTMHRFQERAPPVPMPIQQMEPLPVHQEVSQVQRVSEWRSASRMAPLGRPRHAMEDEPNPEPPVQMYQPLPPMQNRFPYKRRQRQSTKPAFFDGLSNSDGC